MFTEEQEQELRTLHLRYVKATQKNYPEAPVDSFEHIVSNVEKGAAEDEKDMYNLLKCVLSSMLYTSENDMQEMIERAENDYSRRYEEMTPEQQRVCDNYRMPFKSQTI